MNNVELGGTLQHFLKHDEMMSKLITALVIVQSQGPGATWHQSCGRFGIPTGKQRHIMARFDQGLC
jgi:hypothetical protein